MLGLYVFYGVFRGKYTPGMAVAVATNVDEAIELIVKRFEVDDLIIRLDSPSEFCCSLGTWEPLADTSGIKNVTTKSDLIRRELQAAVADGKVEVVSVDKPGGARFIGGGD